MARNLTRIDADGGPHRIRGAIAIEYILILVLVVLPIAAMLPFMLNFIGRYGLRVLWPIGLPFP